jgi:hypothetical protein
LKQTTEKKVCGQARNEILFSSDLLANLTPLSHPHKNMVGASIVSLNKNPNNDYGSFTDNIS